MAATIPLMSLQVIEILVVACIPCCTTALSILVEVGKNYKPEHISEIIALGSLR
jgi:hypothetical protein